MLAQSRMKYPLAGGMILVIAGAVIFAVRAMTGQPAQSARTHKAEIRYQCRECLKEFPMRPQDWLGQAPDQQTIEKDRTAARRPHCPFCKAKHSGLMMVRCHQCGKYYLPAGADPAKAAAGKEVTDICPYCNTDRAQRYRKEFEKGRKQASPGRRVGQSPVRTPRAPAGSGQGTDSGHQGGTHA